MASEEKSLPSHTKGEVQAATAADTSSATDGVEGPSKNALKKAAKEKEKAEKAAKRKAQEEQQKQQCAADDVSKDDYGDLPMVGSKEHAEDKRLEPLKGLKRVSLKELSEYYNKTSFAEEAGGPEVLLNTFIVNARAQSAKLGFLVLGQGIETTQAVVAASDTLSRQMVKFAGQIPAESSVLVHGVVKKPKEEVKSTTVGHLEIHVKRLFVVARAEVLPIQVEDCERALPGEGIEESKEEETGKPIVTLNTRLNNRTIDLRAKINQAIFSIKDEVCWLFTTFLRERGFRWIHTPKLLGAPSEGGSAIFEVKYFDTKAYLAQSPQLYKQMMIAAHYERVFEMNPAFRAENSNTARHLTEFTSLDLEMEFEESYAEVVSLLEELMLYIFEGLRKNRKRETDLVRSTYPVEDFKLPPPGEVPRLSFAEGIRMLKEVGVEGVSEYEDLR